MEILLLWTWGWDGCVCVSEVQKGDYVVVGPGKVDLASHVVTRLDVAMGQWMVDFVRNWDDSAGD